MSSALTDEVPAAFDAVTVIEYVFISSGVPVMLSVVPVLLYEYSRVSGSPLTSHEIGVVPLAEIFAEYFLPVVALAKLGVVITGA